MSVTSVTTPTGGVFEMETLIVYKRGKHVVIYRTLDELFEMLRLTHKGMSYGSEQIEIDFINTTVEQPGGGAPRDPD